MLGLVLVTSACNKDKGANECVWLMETTSMTASICKMSAPTAWEDCTALAAADTVPWSHLQMGLNFGTNYLQNESCSSPRDSLTGCIATIDLTVLENYNSTYTAGANINAITQVRVLLPNGSYSAAQPLAAWLATNPVCTPQARLYLTTAPDSPAPRHFRIVYRESDGTTYTVDTPIAVIIP